MNYAMHMHAYRPENAKTAADAACCRAHRHFPGARKNAPYLCTKPPGQPPGGRLLPILYRDPDRRRAAARGLRAVMARAAARATADAKKPV